ncbi:MAG: glycosyltransferase domain-containing protein [Tepidisphaeraceae bacterium]
MIVYTAIMGSQRDALREIVSPPDPQGRHVEFVCFSDFLTAGDVPPLWEIRPPLWKHPNPRRMARWHKFMAHVALGEETDFSLWMDGTQQLLVNPWDLVDRYLTPDRAIALCRHPERDCVYQELEMCLRLTLDDAETMRRQVERYREEGYPAHHGLFETTAILRSHSPLSREFNERCWREINYGSVRDQLCVNYILWKMQLTPTIMPGQRIASPYFKFYPHQRGR